MNERILQCTGDGHTKANVVGRGRRPKRNLVALSKGVAVVAIFSQTVIFKWQILIQSLF